MILQFFFFLKKIVSQNNQQNPLGEFLHSLTLLHLAFMTKILFSQNITTLTKHIHTFILNCDHELYSP